ncbi:putative GTP-binding controlling metal-binding domain-containing protein [Dichotomocladium elegans]|nr:putative GTP-binding controlling metal-binding domain-containing protein [Dichotomocladium elegans]
MKYRHYSPDAPVVFIDTASDFGFLTTTAPAPEQQESCNIERAAIGKSTEEIARGMFCSLRTLDQKKVDVIFIQGVSETDEGMTAMNRLLKAASQSSCSSFTAMRSIKDIEEYDLI